MILLWKVIACTVGIVIVLPLVCHAGPYVEGGLAVPAKDWIEVNHHDGHTHVLEHEGLHGTAEIGYTYNNASLYVEHISQLGTSDRGLNLVGAKYRWEWK